MGRGGGGGGQKFSNSHGGAIFSPRIRKWRVLFFRLSILPNPPSPPAPTINNECSLISCLKIFRLSISHFTIPSHPSFVVHTCFLFNTVFPRIDAYLKLSPTIRVEKLPPKKFANTIFNAHLLMMPPTPCSIQSHPIHSYATAT